MYSLHLTCSPDDLDLLTSQLWEYGTAGIRELDTGEQTELIAGFDDDNRRAQLLSQFEQYSPEWSEEAETDWVKVTEEAWPAREVGDRLLLAPVWSSAETPAGRIRLIHNPGLASGTGEHPCTQLALMAIQSLPLDGVRVTDVGTGSGLLAIAACQLGARSSLGLDTDISALQVASENFRLNSLYPLLVAGSCDALLSVCSDLTVANISGTVLVSIFDDLLRITSPRGRLILTGFDESELPFFLRFFPEAEVTAINEWRCLSTIVSSSPWQTS